MQTRRARPFIISTGLEQQAIHSAFRADSRLGDREEDNAETLIPLARGALFGHNVFLSWH
jgi:hypothetical protein